MRKMNNKGAEGPTEVILIDGDDLSLTYVLILYILFYRCC